MEENNIHSTIIHKHINNPFKGWHLLAIVIPSFIFFFSVYHFSGKAEVKNAAVSKVVPTPEPRVLVDIGNTQVSALKADTPEKRKLGLVNFPRIAENEGLLYIFDPDGQTHQAISMKDMEFATDFIWISDGTVFQIDENIQPDPAKTESEMRLYLPNQVASFMLQVNAGFAEAHSLHVGDPVGFDILW